MPQHVYVAGPLFTPAERAYLEDLTRRIEALGFTTYLPHRDGGLATGQTDTRPLYDADIRALDGASLIVAVLNGTDVDSGTAFEIGYGIARGVPVFGVSEDARLMRRTGFNAMIRHSSRIFDSQTGLVDALRAHGGM